MRRLAIGGSLALCSLIAQVLYAFDAETGEELYSSRDAIDDWTHLSSITVVDGSVYVTTRRSFVYAFELKKIES